MTIFPELLFFREKCKIGRQNAVFRHFAVEFVDQFLGRQALDVIIVITEILVDTFLQRKNEK